MSTTTATSASLPPTATATALPDDFFIVGRRSLAKAFAHIDVSVDPEASPAELRALFETHHTALISAAELALKEANTVEGGHSAAAPAFNAKLALAPSAGTLGGKSSSECFVACVLCAIDAVTICFSLVAFRASLSGTRAVSMAGKAREIISRSILDPLYDVLSKCDTSSVVDVAATCVKVVVSVLGFGVVRAIISIILDEMSWYEYVLYGAVVLAELATAIATSGTSLAAIAGVNAAVGIGFFAVDVASAVSAC